MIRADASTLLDVWDGVRTQPGRVGLSFLAVSIGIIALTILLAVTSGLREKARMLVKELGAHVVAVLPPQRDAGNRDFPLIGRHADLLAANLPGRGVSAMKKFLVKPEGWEQPLAVISTDDALAQVRQWTLGAGRFLDRQDVAVGERHAVVTRALGARADWNPGSTIILQGLPFTVVGVLDSGGGAAESDAPDARLQLGDEAVFIPHSVSAPWHFGASPASRPLDAVFVQGDPGESMDHLVATCRNVLAAPDAATAAFNWVTPEMLLRGIRRMQQTIHLSVGSISLLCLILGGTTLMSLMLANVRDRVSEIGLRRALGARAADVSKLFVLEACAITLAAAFAGTFTASVLLLLARAHFPAPLRLGPWTFLVPVLASLALGVIFSYWPARMAARIAPAEALRNE